MSCPALEDPRTQQKARAPGEDSIYLRSLHAAGAEVIEGTDEWSLSIS